MRILIVSITPGSAVDRLAGMIKKHNEELLVDIMPFHPKRYSKDDLRLFKEKAEKADIIDFEYWKSAVVLLEKFPELVKSKKTLLTHHNPYDLLKRKWEEFDRIAVKNETQKKILEDSGIPAYLVKHGVDLRFFDFNDNYQDKDNKTVGMVAFRIEGKKGIKEVAEACNELGYRFLLVGHISKPDYFKQIVKAAGSQLDFREDVSDEELRRAYKEMDVFVCNSIDGFETGTLPILEAMASGTPVLTRNIGLVPDLYNGENMVVRGSDTEDKEDLKGKLLELMSDYKKRCKMREKAWDSLRPYSDYRMAKEYAVLYNQLMYPSRPLVSVVTATYNRVEQIKKIMERLAKQTYPNIELVVCDDKSTDGTETEIKGLRQKYKYPIKYVETEGNGYNLAQARNLGLIEASGRFVMILDSRLLPEKNAIKEFIERIGNKPRRWLFGDKGAGKRNFVENFSFARRKELIYAGMFNERINEYGGMSQELRERFNEQGFKMVYIPEAKAIEMISAKKKSEKRDSILNMKDRLWKMHGK